MISVAPTYQQLFSVPKGFGANIKILDLKPENGWLPDLEQLKEHVDGKTKMIVLNNPNNPCGSLIDEPTLRAICEIAEDADPYVLYLYREAVASSNDAWNLIEYRNISDAETEQPQCWLDYPAGAFQNIGGVEYDNENTLILPGDVNVNPHSAESDLVPIFYHRFNTLPDPDGPKGVGSLIVGFCPVDTGSRLESLTVAGVTAAYIRVGRNYSAPWDGSTPSGYSEITGKLWAGGYATKFVVGSPVGLPEDIAGGFSAA